MNLEEAQGYLHTKYELARELSSEERDAFFIEEAEVTREAQIAYLRSRVIPPLGAAATTGSDISTSIDFESRSHDVSTTDTQELEDTGLGETAIQWAHATAQVFRENTKGISGKQRVQRDRMFMRSIMQLSSDGTSVLQHPQFFLTALDVWRAQAISEGSRATQLVDVAVEQARNYVREHWKDFDSSFLSGYIKAGSSDRLSAGTASHLLRSYFQGPSNLEERVDAYYLLASSILDLSEDHEAFAYGTRICNIETDILSDGSKFHTDVNTAYYAATYDLNMMQKARIAVQVACSAGMVMTSEGNEAKGTHSPLLHPFDDLRIYRSIEAISERLTTEGHRDALERLLYVLETESQGSSDVTFMAAAGNTLAQDIHTTKPAWFIDLAINSQDPLADRYRNSIGPRAEVEAFAQQISMNAPPLGYKVTRTEHITLPQGLIVDVYLPSGLLPAQERNLIEELIEIARNKHTEIEIEVGGNKTDLAMLNTVALARATINDQSIYYVYRQSGEFDNTVAHSLNELLWTGFPYGEEQSDNELIQGLVEVQDNIEKYQHRYLNRRGIRINFDPSTQLGRRGFTSIVFREDSKKPQNTKVELMQRGKKHRYTLDDNFNLDLEGKTISSARLRNQVHYSTLLLLRDYICGIVLPTEEGELAASTAGPAARIDYLRYLPKGKMFTPRAVQNYLARRKKDLWTKNEERKRVDPQRRDSTYVKEVEQTNPNLPPLTVFVNPDDFMYDKIIANGFRLPPDLES